MVVKKQKLKIAIIGSSKYKEIDDERKNMAYNSGRAIAESGCILLTGGGKVSARTVLFRKDRPCGNCPCGNCGN